MIKKSRLVRLVVLWALTALFIGVLATQGLAADSTKGGPSKLEFGSGRALALSASDYSDSEHWLSFGGDKSKPVDVFVIYPTVTFSTEESDLPYVRLESGLMRRQALAWLESQANGVLIESANIYAPLYRQLNGAMLAALSNTEFASYTNDIPREDIFAAFAFYLRHINKGERPFILFGHSQGAKLVGELATTFLGNEEYHEHNRNHIITYAIGCSVDASQVAANPCLRFSESWNDTGVLVSWNTTAPSEVASGGYARFGTWLPAALTTNPISWEAHETLAHAAANKASKVTRPDGGYDMIEGYANALVDNEHRVLVTTTVDESKYQQALPNISRFHAYDISFYHDSVKQNVKDRISAFTLK